MRRVTEFDDVESGADAAVATADLSSPGPVTKKPVDKECGCSVSA